MSPAVDSAPLRLVPPPVRLRHEDLRAEVRAFLAEERAAGAFTPRCDAWLSGWDEDFARKLGARGWLGMTIPPEYGGQGRSALERYVVTEELLAAGAPVAAPWIADRQTAPGLLRYGTEAQRQRILPGIARGEWYVGLGLSEPDAGSDLASVRTRARPVDGGWRLTGTKVWTSGAHRANGLVVLVRTGESEEDRHRGLTQFIVELPNDGVEIRPIPILTGEHHFNEMVFDEAFVPEDMVLGEVGNGWEQVTAELAFERSGPERFLSTFALLVALVRRLQELGDGVGPVGHARLGGLLARVWTLRQLSIAVASALAAGEAPAVAAALVKDVGTRFEAEVAEAARLLVEVEPDVESSAELPRLLAEAVLHAPGFTLRGGTNEVLRGIVARGLGVR